MAATPSSDLAFLLAEQCPDAVVFADLQGVIRFWNAAATRIFGFAAEAALGASLDIIVPERFREAHWRGYERALAAGATTYVGQALPTRSAHADGRQLYVELSFAIVTDAAGVVVGALSQARDITTRFEKERGDRKHLQELEAALAEQK